MTLLPAVAAIAESLRPGYWMPHSEHADPDDAQPCPFCDAMVWSVVKEFACARHGEGKPLLLNYEPTAWGRYEMVEPGLARWCRNIRMIEWPLPRYSSHLVDCPVLVARREQERDYQAEQMRYAKEDRKQRKEHKKERMEAYYARFDDPFKGEEKTDG